MTTPQHLLYLKYSYPALLLAFQLKTLSVFYFETRKKNKTNPCEGNGKPTVLERMFRTVKLCEHGDLILNLFANTFASTIGFLGLCFGASPG